MITDPAIQTAIDAIDVAAIRHQFPILNREVKGKPLIYFDNAATSQKPQLVIDAQVTRAAPEILVAVKSVGAERIGCSVGIVFDDIHIAIPAEQCPQLRAGRQAMRGFDTKRQSVRFVELVGIDEIATTIGWIMKSIACQSTGYREVRAIADRGRDARRPAGQSMLVVVGKSAFSTEVRDTNRVLHRAGPTTHISADVNGSEITIGLRADLAALSGHRG